MKIKKKTPASTSGSSAKSNQLVLVINQTYPPSFVSAKSVHNVFETLFLAISLDGEESLKKIIGSGYSPKWNRFVFVIHSNLSTMFHPNLSMTF